MGRGELQAEWKVEGRGRTGRRWSLLPKGSSKRLAGQSSRTNLPGTCQAILVVKQADAIVLVQHTKSSAEQESRRYLQLQPI
jgi:hypothetical protein